MGKISYFEDTWVASSGSAVGGSIYTAILFAILSGGDLSPIELGIAIFFLILISYLMLSIGYMTFGWWITRFISQRVRVNRVAVFAMTGMLLGFIVYLVLLAIFGYCLTLLLPDEDPVLNLPHSLRGWIDYGIFGTIPMFYLTLAGILTGVHQNQVEQQSE